MVFQYAAHSIGRMCKWYNNWIILVFLVQIRDMDVLKTNVFNGQQLFLWHSSGNVAEVEFHGDYLHSKGSFKAEYSFVGH